MRSQPIARANTVRLSPVQTARLVTILDTLANPTDGVLHVDALRERMADANHLAVWLRADVHVEFSVEERAEMAHLLSHLDQTACLSNDDHQLLWDCWNYWHVPPLDSAPAMPIPDAIGRVTR